MSHSLRRSMNSFSLMPCNHMMECVEASTSTMKRCEELGESVSTWPVRSISFHAASIAEDICTPGARMAFASFAFFRSA